MPHLAICFEFATLNGGERSMLAVLDAGCPPGWDITLLMPPDGPLQQAARDAGHSIVDWSIREEGHKPPPEWAVQSLRAAVNDVAADLVHANSLSLARLTGRLAREDGRPTTGHLRDIMRVSQAARDDLNGNRALIAVSPAVERYHTDKGLTGVVTIPNGISPFTPTRAPGWLRDELDVPADVPLLATVGQIGLRKGHDVAAAALRSLAAEGLDFVWLVVGQRFSQKAESIAYEQQLGEGLGDRIRRLGFRDDVLELLAEVDCLLHPARQEPLGRVLLEAREARTPIIACDVGGNRFAAPGAIFVPPDSPAELAAAIRSFLGTRGIAGDATQTNSPASRDFPVERCVETTWAVWTGSLAEPTTEFCS